MAKNIIDLEKFRYDNLRSKSPVKIKRFYFYKIILIQEIKFQETIRRTKFSWKETYRFVIVHSAFSFISFKSTIMQYISMLF